MAAEDGGKMEAHTPLILWENNTRIPELRRALRAIVMPLELI